MKQKLLIMEDFKPYKKDMVVNVNVDLFWRRRLADRSVTIYSEKKEKAKKAEGEKVNPTEEIK